MEKIKLADKMVMGSDFEVVAVVTNNCMETKNVAFHYYARAVTYNGKLGPACGLAVDKVELPSGEG